MLFLTISHGYPTRITLRSWFATENIAARSCTTTGIRQNLVFDCNEAIEGKVARYRILIDRGQITELIEKVHQNTLTEAQARPDALQNLCVLVWSACERYYRGELLSSRQYLDGFVVNQLLTLISSTNKGIDNGEDVLDQRRHLEQRSPKLAAEVQSVLRSPVPEAALLLLEIAEREVKSQSPALAWDNVIMVRGWIAELVKNSTGHNE